MRMNAERREEIGENAEAAARLRGAMTIDRFLAGFNTMTEMPATTEEIIHGIKRYLASTPKYLMINQFSLHNDEFIFSDDLDIDQAFEIIEAEAQGIVLCECGCGAVADEDESFSDDYIIEYAQRRMDLLEEIVVNAKTELKSHSMLIALTAEIAVTLYGVISFEEFVLVFNYYYPKLTIKTTDVKPALILHSDEVGVDNARYSIFEKYIILPQLCPSKADILYQEEAIELIKMVREGQEQTPRYLPDYEEFTQFFNPTINFLKPEVTNFISFVHENIEKVGQSDIEVAETVSAFLEIIKIGLTPEHFLEFFRDSGFKFGSKKFADQFMEHAVGVFHNTNIFTLNGHSVETIADVMEIEKEKPIMRLVPKTGRNDYCPCGSGKKYKKCCL